MIVKIGNTDADVRVEAILSGPRFGPMANFFSWAQALMPLGIRPTLGQGAFWGQVLQRTMEAWIDKVEYILTLDYDTFFSQHDIEVLFATAMTLQCDALTGFQVKREDGRPMLTLLGTQDNPPPDGKTTVSSDWFSPPVQEVDAAHFGCTVISTAALKRTPKPWFMDIPDPTGGYGDGRTDADMFFWKQFRKGGNRVYVTPRVTLGHGEYVAVWPSKNLDGPVFQYCTEFMKEKKKPANAWGAQTP
jgi:hypothetical protein